MRPRGALGEMRPPPIDALRAVLREPPSDFALARAVHAVGSGRLTELAPEVVALTRHQNPEVRLEAYQTIALSGVGSVSSLRASIPDERQELAALLHLHAHADLAPGLEAVERELVSPLQERRHAAAEAVVEIFSSTRPQEARDRIFPRLLAAVADEPDAKVRERLVLALGRVRADAALLTETLLAVLRDDPAEEVRARAAGTLAFVDAHPVRERVAALVDALDDDSLKVRNSAVQALHNMYRTDLITPERMPDLPDLEERLRARA
jgi:HEAT repeat protein